MAAAGSGNNDDLNSSGFLSDNSAYLLGEDVDDADGQDDDEDSDRTGVLREQDRFLPIANVARLMKKAIPASGKIAKDSRECVQECVSEFVSFVTSEASDRCHQEKRKTINGEDILFAMSSLGFDNYIEPLKIYLQKYRDATKGDKVAMDDAVLIAAVGASGVSGLANISRPDPSSATSTSNNVDGASASFTKTQTSSPAKK